MYKKLQTPKYCLRTTSQPTFISSANHADRLNEIKLSLSLNCQFNPFLKPVKLLVGKIKQYFSTIVMKIHKYLFGLKVVLKFNLIFCKDKQSLMDYTLFLATEQLPQKS